MDPVLALLITGVIAPILIQLFKIISAKLGFDLSSKVKTVVVFVVSVVLATFWVDTPLPPLVDPMQFAIALLEAALAVMGLAVGIYELLIKAVFKSVGFVAER